MLSFVVVCLFVCLSVNNFAQSKNVQNGLRDIFWECCEWADEQMIKF